MAKDIRIGIASDTREFASGVQKGVIKPLGDLDKALDDVAKGGTEAGRKLEKSLDGASRETSDFKRQQQDLARTMQSTQAAGTQAVALNARQRRTINQQAVRQAGAQARQSVASDAAAMATSTEGALNGIGNTAGAILSGFGPVGVGIGVAIGVATGLVSGLLAKGTEQTKKFKSGVKDLTTELIAVRDKGGPSLGFIVDKLKELATNSEAGETRLEDLNRAAAGNVDRFRDLAQAYAGNTDELQRLKREGEDYLQQLRDELDMQDITTDSGVQRTSQLNKQITAQQNYNKYLGEASDKAREAAKAEKLYLQAGGDEMVAKADLIKSIDSAYDKTAGSIGDFLDKEKSALNIKKYIAAMEARSKALADYQTNLASADLSTEAKAFLADQGADAAAQFLEGYTRANATQKKTLNKIWTEAGKSNSGDYSKQLEKGIPDKIKAPKVEAPDTAAAERELNRWANQQRTIKVTVKTVDKYGRDI